MRILQEQLLNYPLTSIVFHTSLPLVPIEYEQIIETIPTHFLEKNSILYLYTIEDCLYIQQMECFMRLIQDTQIKAIIVASNQTFNIDSEIIYLLQSEKIPFIQLTDKRLASLWISSKQQMDTNFISTELHQLMTRDLEYFLFGVSRGIQVPFLYVDEEYQPLIELGNNDDIMYLKQWLNINLRKLVMKQMEDVTSDVEIIHLYLATKKEYHLMMKKDLMNWQMKWIDKLANLLALFNHTNTLFQTVHQKQKEQFLNDLLFSKIESTSQLMKRGREFGLNLENPYFLLIIDKKDVCNQGAFQPNDLVEWLSYYSQTINETMVVDYFQEQWIVFIEVKNNVQIENKKKYITDLAKHLYSALSELYQTTNYQIGIGNFYESFIHLNKSYQEAKLALKFGVIWNEEQSVYHINDLGIIRLLLYNHEEVLRAYSQDYLKELITSDNQHGTNYINTLSSYIKFNGNISDVSNHLFIHPNTLRNRLKKMEEMTGMELSNLQQISHLIIALKIKTFIESKSIT